MSNAIEKKQTGAGRPPKLTNELLKQLTRLWALAGEKTLSDSEIARSLGLEPKQLENWLTHDTLGISGIRARARAGIKLGYLWQLNKIGEKAIALDDFRTASAVYQFLLERQYPREFGRFLKVHESRSSDWLETASEDELAAFIDENRQLINSKKTLDVPADNEDEHFLELKQ